MWCSGVYGVFNSQKAKQEMNLDLTVLSVTVHVRKKIETLTTNNIEGEQENRGHEVTIQQIIKE